MNNTTVAWWIVASLILCAASGCPSGGGTPPPEEPGIPLTPIGPGNVVPLNELAPKFCMAVLRATPTIKVTQEECVAAILRDCNNNDDLTLLKTLTNCFINGLNTNTTVQPCYEQASCLSDACLMSVPLPP